MAYSSVWSNSRPQGTVDADTIDEEIQQVRIDINDRLSDLFGIVDFTTDPLKAQYVRVGYAGAGSGGHVRHTDDGGTTRWYSGVIPGVANRDYIIWDVVEGQAELTVGASNTGVTVGHDLTVSGNIGTPGNLTVNGIAKLGVAGTNTGGQLQYVTDDGVNRWATGLLHSASETRYVLYDNAQGRIVFQADATTSLISMYYGIAVGASPAGTGTIRIPNNSAVIARNAANNGDASLMYLDGANATQISGSGQTTNFGGAVSASSYGQFTSLILGSNYAGAGIIRLPNNAAITARNAANTADINLLYLDGSNVIQHGAAGQFNGAVTATQFNGPLVGNVTGTVTGSVTGNAGSATKLATARTINGVNFDGTGNIIVPAAANTLTGTALPALDGSQLTNLTGGNVTGTVANATNATNAGNATNLGGVSASSYALISETRNFVTTGTVTAHAFYVV